MHYNVKEDHGNWRDIPAKECQHCGEMFDRTFEKPLNFEAKKFCSKECRTQGRNYLRGEDSPHWKPNSPPRQRCAKHDTWAKRVKEKDHFTCVVCDAKDVKLHSHHVFAYIDYPGYRFDISNGRTMCVPCHYELHSFETELKGK